MKNTQDIKHSDETAKFRRKVITPAMMIQDIAELFAYEKLIGKLRPSTYAGPIEALYFKEHKDLIIRYKRVYALLKAYGLLTVLENFAPVNSFVNGKFISKDFSLDEDAQREIWDILENAGIDPITPLRLTIQFRRKRDYPDFFYGLMRYRLNIHLLEQTFRSYLVMPAGTGMACETIHHLSTIHLQPIKETLDNLMLSFLRDNDRVRNYSVGQLIDNYGYPQITDEELIQLEIYNW